MPEFSDFRFEATFADGTDGLIRVLCDISKSGCRLRELQLTGMECGGADVTYVLAIPDSVDAAYIRTRHAKHPIVERVRIHRDGTAQTALRMSHDSDRQIRHQKHLGKL